MNQRNCTTTIYDFFSFRRFMLIMRIEIHERWRLYILPGIIIAGFYMLRALFVIHRGSTVDPGIGQFTWIIVLFIGLIITSSAFNDLHTETSAASYLMIPASSAEKYLSRVLSLTCIYFICTLIIITAASTLAAAITALAQQAPIAHYNPFNRRATHMLGIYLYMTIPFLLGALIFKRHSFLKTALFLVVLHIVLFIAFLTAGTFFVLNIEQNMEHQIIQSILRYLFDNPDQTHTSPSVVRRLFINFVLPLMFYYLGFHIFKRKKAI